MSIAIQTELGLASSEIEVMSMEQAVVELKLQHCGAASAGKIGSRARRTLCRWAKAKRGVLTSWFSSNVHNPHRGRMWEQSATALGATFTKGYCWQHWFGPCKETVEGEEKDSTNKQSTLLRIEGKVENKRNEKGRYICVHDQCKKISVLEGYCRSHCPNKPKCKYTGSHLLTGCTNLALRHGLCQVSIEKSYLLS